jgi:hypothetical protein
MPGKATLRHRVVLYVAAILVLLSAFAKRADAVSFGQYYDYVYKINIGSDNYLYINVVLNSGVNFAPGHGCSTPYYARSLEPMSSDRTKAWLQMATASLLSHAKVYIYTSGCTTNASTGYPIMMQFQLEQ